MLKVVKTTLCNAKSAEAVLIGQYSFDGLRIISNDLRCALRRFPPGLAQQDTIVGVYSGYDTGGKIEAIAKLISGKAKGDTEWVSARISWLL
jgi:hypothetical protein